MKKLPLACLLLTLYAGIPGCNDRPDRQSLQNIEAFARMYGLVRWFHPSDEAQRVDWNRFALYGVERVAACESTEELERELERLFRPLAPGIGFSDHGRDEGLPARITPPDTSGRQVVAWQHKGVDTETAVFLDGQIFNGDYISKRTNRPLEYRNDKRLVLFGQLFPAADYGDHEIKVRARIRKYAPSDDLRLSFKIATRPQWRDVVPFGPDADRWLVQNDGQWETYERSLSVAAENRGEAIRWGIYADGEGSFSVGAIEMENLKTGKKSPSPVYESRSYRYRTDSSGRYDIRVYDLLPARMQLFEGHASCGEYRSERLTEGLYAHVPLALYDTRSGTYPSGDPETLEDLLRATESAAPSDRAKMYADLIVAWNAIKYFGPYLAEMRLDWDEELRKALSRASRCKRYDLRPLRLMMAQIEDAHVRYVEPAASKAWERFLPLQVRRIGKQIVVTDSKDSSLRKGDIVRTVDGADATDDFRRCEEMISGGPHFKAWMAAREWQCRPGQGRITLEIEREGRRRTITTHCLKTPEYAEWLRSLRQQRPSRWIDGRTLYLNLACTGLDEAKELLKNRQPGQTVIADMRNGIGFLFQDLIAPLCPDVRRSFRQGTSLVPCPTHPEIPELKDTLPDIAPPEPNRKNIFLTGPSNLSHHESVLDFVRYAGLGYLVGTNTGGCTGPINYLPLPSGYEVAFTGTKVLSNLGRSRYFYRTGIRPDRYVEETADDIRLGRDVALEEALRIAGAPPSAGNP
ncbi:hypothetical protein [Alistipes ihumii]|uniref:hypothetical protein n=1 Tax=Alistipes ihumii TaxID=1470347 RepID=UPI003AF4949A